MVLDASDEPGMEAGEGPAQSVLVETALPIDADVLEQRVGEVFAALEKASAEVCVLLVDDAQIAELNEKWRGVEGPTDVLSFSMVEGEGSEFAGDMLGDVVVSVETATRVVADAEHRKRVAGELGVDPESLTWSVLDEVTFLAIHGALHLLGHDHAEPDEEAVMRALEARLMAPFVTKRV